MHQKYVRIIFGGVLLLSTCIVACKRNNISNDLIQADTILFEDKVFDIADTRLQSDPVLQSHFKLTYPEITDEIPAEALENIQAHIAGFILDSEKPVKEFPNIQKQADKLFNEYDEVYKEFPRTSTWLVDKKIQITSKVGPLISLEFTESSYKGGAHPNSVTFFKTFDINDGREVSMYELIDSTQLTALNALRLKYFEEQKEQILQGENWKDYIFAEEFEVNGAFNTNKNIRIAKDTVSFYYNSYEIAPYAFGPTDLKIPLDQLKPFLKKDSPYYKYF